MMSDSERIEGEEEIGKTKENKEKRAEEEEEAEEEEIVFKTRKLSLVNNDFEE